MNNLKPLLLFFAVVILSAHSIFAQDSTKTAPSTQVFAAIEQEPTFPGGVHAFSKFIGSNLKYPDVARVIGLTGKVFVTFVIERDGSVSNVTPIKCMGAGCESEAVRVISMSPNWSPGFQKGKAVRVQYTIPISFDFTGDKSPTYIKNLKRSDYGFVFFIKGKTYTVDEAQNILGKSFDPAIVETVENYDNPQYAMPDKKGVYLIVIKDS